MLPIWVGGHHPGWRCGCFPHSVHKSLHALRIQHQSKAQSGIQDELQAYQSSEHRPRTNTDVMVDMELGAGLFLRSRHGLLGVEVSADAMTELNTFNLIYIYICQEFYLSRVFFLNHWF